MHDLESAAARLVREARALQERVQAHPMTPMFDHPVECICAPAEVARRLAHACSAARRLRVMTASSDVPWRLGTPEHRALLSGGAHCSAIYDRRVLDEAALTDLEAASSGQEARVLPTLPVSMVLVDDRWAAVVRPSPETDARPTLVVVDGTSLFEAFALLFDGLWQRALPVHIPSGAARQRARGPSAPETEQILAMLLSGVTDEVMARRLGISYRTLQRRIADIMATMGVRSRFQLGIQVALRKA